MARIRSVKPEFWIDRKLARQLSRDARLLYIGLWNFADEHARLIGDPFYVKGQVFPYDDDLTPDGIEKLIEELITARRAVRYEIDGEPYLFLPMLRRHQRLESEKVPSRLPAPPDPDDSGPRPDKSAPRPDKPAPGSDKFAQSNEDPPDWANEHVTDSAQIGADLSAQNSDESARRANSSALLYVAGDTSQESGIENLSSPTAPPPADKPPASKPKDGKKRKASAEPRPDVEALCNRLVELMVANGSDKPTITPTWRNEARLLLDLDHREHGHRELHQAMWLLNWALTHHFWWNKIRSMPKFRKQYGQLRDQVLDERDRRSGTEAPPPGTEVEVHAGNNVVAIRPNIPAPRPSTTDRAVASGDTALAEFRRMTGRTA